MNKTIKIISLAMALTIFISIFTTVSAVSVYNNHTIRTNTAFTISDSGMASVYTCYNAWEDVMTEATITITIKKRTLLFFWNEVTTHTLYSTEIDYSNTFTYQLTDTGTYKCEVEYVISGTAGEADVLPFEDTATY